MLIKTIKVFLLAAALLAAMIWLTGGKGVQYAVENKYHVVGDGQTVWGIATKYFPEQNKTRDIRELVHDIRQANNIRDCIIRPGDVLVIPLSKRVDK